MEKRHTPWPEVEANPHLNPPVRWARPIPIGEALLDLDGAADPLERTRELDEEPVANRLDLPAAMGGKHVAQHLAVFVQEFEGEGLVALG
jgi:hypothetical protein